jgi:hypothetical protein
VWRHSLWAPKVNAELARETATKKPCSSAERACEAEHATNGQEYSPKPAQENRVHNQDLGEEEGTGRGEEGTERGDPWAGDP